MSSVQYMGYRHCAQLWFRLRYVRACIMYVHINRLCHTSVVAAACLEHAVLKCKKACFIVWTCVF